MTKKRWLKWGWNLLVIYLLGAMALYFLQDYILFHPVRLDRATAYTFPLQHKDISIPLNTEDTLSLIDVPADSGKRKGIVLYFHGNKRNIAWYTRYIPWFTRQGYEVLMIDYPGFGKSTGRLTEKKLYSWARNVYNIASKRFPPDSIIIYGKSMGTGIAAELASARDCKRLILETPYYDFPAVVSHYLPMYPVKYMLHYEFPTHSYLPDVKAPVTIFHGTSDGVVPYKNTRRLIPLLKPDDEVITVKGGSHNNLYDYPEMTRKLDSVLAL